MNHETKQFYDVAYGEGHASRYGDVKLLSARNDELWRRTREWLEATGLAHNNRAKILEIGCGMAGLATIHPGWHGAEYSRAAVERVKAHHGEAIRITEADAQNLPYETGAFDAVYTWATLEHVPDPGKALSEIDRVLRGGGIGLIAPAWNCRSWTVVKLPERSYSELTWVEFIAKFTIPVREHIAFRALRSLPSRLWGECRLLAHKPKKLVFKSLSPRWDLIEKYGHTSDDDAVADIDPHAAICFFQSRGYEIVSHPSILKRLMARHEPVHVVKPNTY